MTGYVVRRLLVAASLVLAVSFVAFLVFGLSLDPTYPYVLGDEHTHQIRRLVQHRYHLDRPILLRYWFWVKGLFTHGFGTTVLPTNGPLATGEMPNGTPIGPLVASATAVTAQLLAVSLAVVVAASAALGTLAATRRNSALDVALRVLAYAAWSLPTFLLGVLLSRWLIDDSSWFLTGRPGGGFVLWWRHMTLPVLTLSLGLIGYFSRYVRTAMVAALGEPYTVTARGKGLSEPRVVVRHALRNSLVPFTSVLSLEFGAIVGASLAADYVFRLDGLASLFLASLGEADPFELTALVVVIAAVVAALVVLGDLVLGMLDPRLGERVT